MIARLELGDGEFGRHDSAREKLRDALEAAGVEFTNGGQPGVRLKAKERWFPGDMLDEDDAAVVERHRLQGSGR